MNKISQHYYEWMQSLVCPGKHPYNMLFDYLMNTIYIPYLPMDDNRRVDGIQFRYRFGYENGYSDEEIENSIRGECTMFEMMCSLAFRIEEQVAANPEFGNRTQDWFMSMLTSMNLASQTDDNFSQVVVQDILDRFMSNKYLPNGIGGLFRINNAPEDLRNIDIWMQAMWFLNESIYNEKIVFD